jgi:hypothetical protein
MTAPQHNIRNQLNKTAYKLSSSLVRQALRWQHKAHRYNVEARNGGGIFSEASEKRCQDISADCLHRAAIVAYAARKENEISFHDVHAQMRQWAGEIDALRWDNRHSGGMHATISRRYPNSFNYRDLRTWLPTNDVYAIMFPDSYEWGDPER